MNIRRNSFLAALTVLLMFAMASPLCAAIKPVTTVKTNYNDRWITNTIEVSMPRNIITDVYRTNYLAKYHTNVVDVFHTNLFTAYQTNMQDVFITNTVPVSATNFAQAWVTNTKTFWVTNFATVLVLKTNFVAKTVTNVVEVEVSAPARAAAPPAVAAKPVVAAGQIVVDVASQPGKLSGSLNVTLTARTGAGPALSIVGWNVQSENGAIMFFGRERVFKRDLPPGRYTVELTSQTGEARQSRSKSTLVVGERQAAIVSQPVAAR